MFYRTEYSEDCRREINAEKVMQADTRISEHDEGSAEGDALGDPQHSSQLSGMHLLLLDLIQYTNR